MLRAIRPKLIEVLDSTIQSSDEQPSLSEKPLSGRAAARSGSSRSVSAKSSTSSRPVLTNEQVARRLSLSVHAIKFHLARIYRKLAVANRTEAVFVLMTNRRLDD